MTKPATTALIRATATDIDASAVIALCARHKKTLPTIGFAYTSAAAAFFEVRPMRRAEPVLYAPGIDENNTIDVAHVFELRLFNEHADLHWVRKGKLGRLTVQIEGPRRVAWWRRLGRNHRQRAVLRPFAVLEGLSLEQTDVEGHDHAYLLWGNGLPATGPAEGWATTSCARVGPLHIPLALSKGQRAVIRAREYFARKAQGNVCFVGERLLGPFQPASGSGG